MEYKPQTGNMMPEWNPLHQLSKFPVGTVESC